jgi:membrane carboxypeptidase/penicillin-binding protein
MATPLTVCLVVLGKHLPALGFIVVLMGDRPVIEAKARYYQRLLARDQDEAADIVETYVTADGRESEIDSASGEVLSEAARTSLEFNSSHLNLIQEGLRGVVRIPGGTAHSLYGRDFPIPVMGKTGTTSEFRDALFVGSTYGPQGVTVAIRIGFDDNRTLGDQETGGRAALPIFREIMLRTYQLELVGSVPSFPREIEDGIDQYPKGDQSR